MADPEGFLNRPARRARRRPVRSRVHDWGEVYRPFPLTEVSAQAGRCMDCGVPFCHSETVGCPLGNLIPEWNDLVRTGRWRAAAERLHATNNFPEFTGRLCPAPCESACVLGLIDEPVTIEQIEKSIADRAWRSGWVVPLPPARVSGRTVAIVGSGPAGLAAAQQLARAGHEVTVYEREPAAGGLLRYGIPAFKLEKAHVDRRLGQLVGEGVRIVTGVSVGDELPVDALRAGYDAVVLAIGAGRARDLPAPGRDLAGIHPAMEYLTAPGTIDADGRRVVIVGGGDTAADCLGTAHRQGAADVVQLDIYPRPPSTRDPSTPWPLWPFVLREYPAHEEGGHRDFAVTVDSFIGAPTDTPTAPHVGPAVDGGPVPGSRPHVGPDVGVGRVRAVRVRRAAATRGAGGARSITPTGEPWDIRADLVLLAIGFAGVERMPLLDDLGIATPDGRIPVGPDWQTEARGVFACGDGTRGASLVVWAIAEGRAVASAVDSWLQHGPSDLPAPVRPGRTALRA